MNKLYPLKFAPIILDKIWGGTKLKDILHKPTESNKAGESWEISGYPGLISVVSEGFLAGNNLEELIEVYMGDLVGDRNYAKYGLVFPLLVKFIDANDVLSIQVHPGDELAKERHNSFGKTEMWYIVQADEGSELILGFNREVSKEIYVKHLEEKKLMSILNTEPVKPGDVFYLPAGRVHAIGEGIVLAEIQQTSDLTYRIYDFDRKDDKGNYRELHTEQALDAIDYHFHPKYRTSYANKADQTNTVIRGPYFTTNKLELTKPMSRDTGLLDCFVIYMCLEGACRIVYGDNESVSINTCETVLIPAMITEYRIEPTSNVSLLEVYIEHEKKAD